MSSDLQATSRSPRPLWPGPSNVLVLCSPLAWGWSSVPAPHRALVPLPSPALPLQPGCSSHQEHPCAFARPPLLTEQSPVLRPPGSPPGPRRLPRELSSWALCSFAWCHRRGPLPGPCHWPSSIQYPNPPWSQSPGAASVSQALGNILDIHSLEPAPVSPQLSVASSWSRNCYLGQPLPANQTPKEALGPRATLTGQADTLGLCLGGGLSAENHVQGQSDQPGPLQAASTELPGRRHRKGHWGKSGERAQGKQRGCPVVLKIPS